jgi:anti-sigma-K factor RskA
MGAVEWRTRGSALRSAQTLAVLVLACALQSAFATPARAQVLVRSIRTQGEFVKYDAETGSISVKVTQPGNGPEAKSLKIGTSARFLVTSEGSVLARTMVAIQGVKAGLADIEPGRTVNVYWRPDPADPKARHARKIDVIFSAQELDARFGTE